MLLLPDPDYESKVHVKSLDPYLLKFHRKIVQVKEFSFADLRATDRRFIFVFVLFEKQGRARENERGARTLPRCAGGQLIPPAVSNILSIPARQTLMKIR